jgi:hypothetical protein
MGIGIWAHNLRPFIERGSSAVELAKLGDRIGGRITCNSERITIED